MGRTVDWEGFYNARDLGGLPTSDGATTTRAQVFRSATLHLATSAGWRAASAAGVRTVVSLLNDDEIARAGGPPADGSPSITHERVALDALEDIDLWEHIRAEGLDGTPLYFGPLLQRRPDRAADAIRVVARAQPGAVLLHCGAGRDRTGLISALLLALAGASENAIVEDYLLSAAALRPLADAMGMPDQQPLVEEAVKAHGHTVDSSMRTFLREVDVHDVLQRGGLDDDDLTAVRHRLRSDNG